jgi:Smg protein
MFDVLVFVYENFWQGATCPEPPLLKRKLSAVGFEEEVVQEALTWLTALNLATSECHLARTPSPAPSPGSLRVYSVSEQDHLGAKCLAYIGFLEGAGYLDALQREIVLERAMAARHDEVLDLDDLRIIVLMVYWSLGIEPDALLLDELCEDNCDRLAH